METYSICIVEHDRHGDHLCTWVFPGVSQTLQSLIIRKSVEYGETSTFFLKYKNDWIYFSNIKKINNVLPDLSYSTVVIVSRAYNRPLFYKILSVFADIFEKTGDVTKILEAYLSFNATGKFGHHNLNDTTPETVRESAVKNLVERLGADFVLLWNAMLLKRNILVVGESVIEVADVLDCLASLVSHRKEINYLRPLLSADPDQLEDIASCGYYVGGTVSRDLEGRSDLYDLLLNLNEGRLSVPPHATDKMRMTSIHRDLANSIVEMGANGSDADDLLKCITSKTSQVLQKLMQCKSESNGKVSEDSINALVSNSFIQQWLYRLAIAEDML